MFAHPDTYCPIAPNHCGTKSGNQSCLAFSGPGQVIADPVSVPSMTTTAANTVQQRAARLQQYIDQLLATLQTAVSK